MNCLDSQEGDPCQHRGGSPATIGSRALTQYAVGCGGASIGPRIPILRDLAPHSTQSLPDLLRYHGSWYLLALRRGTAARRRLSLMKSMLHCSLGACAGDRRGRTALAVSSGSRALRADTPICE